MITPSVPELVRKAGASSTEENECRKRERGTNTSRRGRPHKEKRMARRSQAECVCMHAGHEHVSLLVLFVVCGVSVVYVC